jgi:uncharacterized damage-inducible protein DinB
MDAVNVLHYGHATFCDAVDLIPESKRETDGVCGAWSVKDIIAHLASFEHLLTDILNGFLGGSETPTLDTLAENGPIAFNDNQVALRKSRTVAQILAEYSEAHERNMALIRRIPQERRREVGALPWYGAEYDLEDYIAYACYGHKREHSAQIHVFADTLQPPQ